MKYKSQKHYETSGRQPLTQRLWIEIKMVLVYVATWSRLLRGRCGLKRSTNVAEAYALVDLREEVWIEMLQRLEDWGCRSVAFREEGVD